MDRLESNYPMSPNAVKPPTPSQEISANGIQSVAALEKQLIFMREEHKNLESAIREIEARCAEIAGMNKLTTAMPGSIHPQGMR